MSTLKEYIDVQLSAGERDLDMLVKTLIHVIPEEVQREEFGWLVRARVKEALGLLDRPRISNPSPRLAKIREHFLDTKVYTSYGSFKALGNCTFADLLEAANLLNKTAQSYLDQAKILTRIAQYLKTSGINKVSEINPDVLKNLTSSDDH